MNDDFRLRWTEIVQLFRTKDAICEGNRTFSYEALFRRASQYANELLNREFRQQCIPVLLEDPLDHIAALFGVLLSGNYYHSIRSQSTDYVSNLLASLACPCLISDLPLVIPNYPALPTLTPELLQPVGSTGVGYPMIRPDTNFCLFTTSGSTGQPKQVIHSHQSVLVDTYRQIAGNEIGPADQIDLLFSLEFSASLACIFPALLSGATLVLYDLKKEGVLSLPTFWEQQKITFSSLSVSTFRLLIKSDIELKKLSDLRMLSIGAEPVRPADISGFQERFPANTILQVAYATTETRTISEQKIRTDTPISDSLFSVGKPVAGRTVSIWSDTGELLPRNQVGEIKIQARFIPSGYPNNLEATRRAYDLLPDGTVQYATGDLGFLDADGYLFWCGRTDFLVKINGQKVSLIQVEHELKSEPGVKNAAVIYDTATGSRPLLSAYLCTEPGFDLAVLKQSLAQRLPVIMLPDRYRLLDTLPLTRTGKVDRMQLAANQEPEQAVVHSRSTTDVEPADFLELIKLIWQEELGLTTALSDYDDFFYDLGGDSLLAESCLAELEKRIEKKIPSHALHSYTTPKALAYFLTGYMNQHQVQCIPLNEAIPNRKMVYFIPSLPGNRRMYRWIENHLNQKSNLYYVHYETFDAEGNLIPLPDLARQIAQTIAKPAESVLIGYSFGGMIAYQVALSLEQMKKPALHRLTLLDTPLYRRITFFESLRNDARRVRRKFFLSLNAARTDTWSVSLQRAVTRYRKRFDKPSESPVVINKSINWRDSCLLAVHQYTQRINVQIPVACPILLFKAKDTSQFQFAIRPDFHWQPYTTAGFDEYSLDANHGQVLDSVNSHIIGTIIHDSLTSEIDHIESVN